VIEPWERPTGPQPAPLPYPHPAPPRHPYTGYCGAMVGLRNGLGIASLVTGVIAIFPGILTCAFGLPLGIIAVLMGFAARRRVKRGKANNGGVALAGIILGFVAIVTSVVLVYVSYPWLRDAYDYYECTSHSVSKGHPECDWAPPSTERIRPPG
jgi:hypothetical protein